MYTYLILSLRGEFSLRTHLWYIKISFGFAILKCIIWNFTIWKMWFLKTQLSIWPLKLCVLKKNPSYIWFENAYLMCFYIAIFQKQNSKAQCQTHPN